MPNEAVIFWANLDKIKDSLLVSEEDFAQSIGLNFDDYKKSKSQAQFLPLNCVFELAEKMNIHFEDLLKTDFKLKETSRDVHLLERYRIATYSHTKPIINILNYLEQVRGPRAKLNLLRKFQLSESFIADENQKANIFLISDIVEYLQKTYQFNYNNFLSMGQRTPHVTSNNFLKSKLTNHSSVQAMLDQFFSECTHVFDKNCTYRLDSLTPEFAIVAAIPKSEVLEELDIKMSDFSNDSTAITRLGVISSMTWFQYKMNAPVRRISSIYDGDKCDRYLLDLSPFKGQSSSARASLGQTAIYH